MCNILTKILGMQDRLKRPASGKILTTACKKVGCLQYQMAHI